MKSKAAKQKSVKSVADPARPAGRSLQLDEDMAFQERNRFPRAERLIDGLPLVIVDQGRPLRDRMRRSRVDEEDILAAARKYQGLERMDQIKYAVLETNGGISIIPKGEG